MFKSILQFVKGEMWKVFPKYWRRSYSQEGEDMILRRYFESQQKGFFVDIGAHHPKRFSNTYAFYKMGWHGLNVDAMPGSMVAFNKQRKKDINIEAAISNETAEMTYYIFRDPALNSFSKELADYRESLGIGCDVISSVTITTKKLEEILDAYLPVNQVIDFMSIDVEGLDLQVLKSNNWDKYCPRIILSEILTSSLNDLINDPITIFLASKGYHMYGKCINTVIYRHNTEMESTL